MKYVTLLTYQVLTINACRNDDYSYRRSGREVTITHSSPFGEIRIAVTKRKNAEL